MKIGILTHHYVSNYGAFLQAYALTEVISKEFPNDTVEIIDYLNVKHFVINSGGWFRFYSGRENLKCWREKIRVPVTFTGARRKELHLSPRCYTAKQVNQLGYDLIVVGSDEVWNYQDKKSGAEIKFGCGLTCPNIIAYAPSVGNSCGVVPDYVRNGIKKFRAISVRDEATEKLVREVTGKKPIRVLDPTCLTEIPGKAVGHIRKPYILFYYCDHLTKSIKDRILAYAKAGGMAVYGAGECGSCYDAVTVNLHPFEWVEMFRQAECVFTGTFHGALFSILNRRQFWVNLTNPSRIQKVKCLLKEFGIQNRTMDEEFAPDTAEQIDYSAVFKRLEDHRRRSLDYLRDVIEEVRESQK